MAALVSSIAVSTQAQTFTNASFETWHNYSVSTAIFPPASIDLTAPTGWCGVDSLIASVTSFASLAGVTITPQQQLFQSSVAHSGSSSAEIRSVFLGDTIGNIPGVLVNAQINIDIAAAAAALTGGGNVDILSLISYTGGTDITAKVDTVKAWVQLDSANSVDSAFVTATTTKTVTGSSGDSTVVVGLGTYLVVPHDTNWVQIAIPLMYADTTIIPQKLIVAFMSSNFAGDTIHAGNKMRVDDVSYSYKTSSGTAIIQPLMSENNILVYPNPTKNQVYFNLSASVKPTDFNLSVYDINGRLISNEQLKQAVNSKNVSTWSKGTYYYQLNDTKNGKNEKGQFIVE